MSEPTLNEQVQERFRLVCRKCGSDDVVININQGFGGSECTGADPDELTIGCNACRQNDYSNMGWYL